jgi:hypothetical protein
MIMPKNLPTFTVTSALTTVFLATMSNATTAGSFTRGCAARDLQILQLIEEKEASREVPAERLSDAMFAMMSARMICYEGRVPDALELYERISKGIAAETALSERR